MPEALIGLGSNLGDKAANLGQSLELLAPHTRIVAVSSLWKTDPVGFLDQDWFLNAAAAVETALTPEGLLSLLLDVERQLGRVRTQKNGPRTVDLDLLLWGSLQMENRNLELPHPRMHQRMFVLAPLREIRAHALHPVLNRTVEALYLDLVEASGTGAPGVERIAGGSLGPWPPTGLLF